jgi:hypothetical protein
MRNACARGRKHTLIRLCLAMDRGVGYKVAVAMAQDDRDAIAESVSFGDGDDESISIDVVIANLGWDEDPAQGRDEMTGAWRLSFRDSLPNREWRIDRPRESVLDAQDAARRMVAARLMGDADLSGGQPHITAWY